MRPILSQLDKIPADFFVLWCMAALVTLGVVVRVVAVWSNLRQRPPHETPTRREFDSLAGKVSHIEASLPTMERRILDAVEKSEERLAVKVAKARDETHVEAVEIFARLNGNDKQIARLEAKATKP